MQKSNTEGLLNSIKSKFTFKFKLLHTFFFSFPTHSTLLCSKEVLHIAASGAGGSHEPFSPFFFQAPQSKVLKNSMPNSAETIVLKSSSFAEIKLFQYEIRHWPTRKAHFSPLPSARSYRKDEMGLENITGHKTKHGCVSQGKHYSASTVQG